MAAPPRRRWFQFSVRTTLALIAVLALWLAYGLHWVKSRDEALRYLKFVGVEVPPPFTPLRPWRELPLTLRLLQAEPVALVNLSPVIFSEDDRDRLQSLFPEATITLQPPSRY